jgi:hypothetical protein
MSPTRKQFKLNTSFQVGPGTALIKQRSSDFVGKNMHFPMPNNEVAARGHVVAD